MKNNGKQTPAMKAFYSVLGIASLLPVELFKLSLFLLLWENEKLAKNTKMCSISIDLKPSFTFFLNFEPWTS